MALTRIWSAFIIIAILVATVKYVAVPEKYTGIYGAMVSGKSGDSIKLATIPVAGVSAQILQGVDSNKTYTAEGLSYIRKDENNFQTYLIQGADGVIETCKVAVNICIGLIGIMALFMGFMGIAERAGGVNLLSRIIGPFFSRIFPDVPNGHPALGHMMMNFSANLLGLDNAATPFGIKAMESLQDINPDKDRASNAQLMFLCLHASGLTLIPVSIIAIRAGAGSSNPMSIFIPCMIATFAATMASLFIVSFKQKINLLQPVIIAWIAGISAIIAAVVWYITTLNDYDVRVFSTVVSSGLILLIFFLIVLGGLYKKVDIFSSFIDGAKGGFDVAVKIIPYLVGMLVAISLLRTSGTFDAVIDGIKALFAGSGLDTRFVDGLPTALVKPFSGGAARGMMVSTMEQFGPDSFEGSLSSVLQGSSDTTFYVVAVYFGAVAVKNTRYAIGAMLLADLVGISTSIALAYLFFG